MAEKTCYDCMHAAVCRFTPTSEPTYAMPPIKDENKIRGYLVAVTRATAEACSEYLPKERREHEDDDDDDDD